MPGRSGRTAVAEPPAPTSTYHPGYSHRIFGDDGHAVQFTGVGGIKRGRAKLGDAASHRSQKLRRNVRTCETRGKAPGSPDKHKGSLEQFPTPQPQEDSVKRALLAACVAASLIAIPATDSVAGPRKAAVAIEKAEHPRIANAIKELNDAIDYLENAPHDFGGHKAAAIEASRAAVIQLKLALAYRAVKDLK
jgi:hypothetical protein